MRLIHLLIAFLLVSVAVSAQSFDVLESNVAIIVEPGNSETGIFTISNTGSTSLSGFTFSHNIDLSDNENDLINLSFSNPGTIAAGSISTVTITADTPLDLDIDTYSGTVTATDSTGATSTFNLDIQVEPIVCDSGITGNDLVLDIEDPDDNEDFKPGEDINVKANVQNNGDRSLDVQVEAFLFDDESEVANAASETESVGKGDDDDFEFALRIPTDNEDVQEGNYLLVVKAFREDQESSNCIQSSISVEVKLDSDDLEILDNSRFDTPSVSCGQLAVATINVVNVGDDNQDDVILTVSNSRLGIREKLPAFDIDSFESEEDNEVSKRLNIKIPDNVAAGDYSFDAVLDYDGKRASKALPLTITTCSKQSAFSAVANAELKALTSIFDVEQGDLITVPVKVINNDANGLFTLSFANFEDFAEPISAKSVNLVSSQESTVFLNLRVQDSAEPGRYSVTINLASGSKIVGSDTLAVDVRQKTEPSFSFKDVPSNVWLGLDILILIILITFILVMISRKKA